MKNNDKKGTTQVVKRIYGIIFGAVVPAAVGILGIVYMFFH